MVQLVLHHKSIHVMPDKHHGKFGHSTKSLTFSTAKYNMDSGGNTQVISYILHTRWVAAENYASVTLPNCKNELIFTKSVTTMNSPLE